MAKMLTKVWKTVQNTFHETKKEALEYERKMAIQKAVDEAWEECVDDEVMRAAKFVGEREARDWIGESVKGYTDRVRFSFRRPSGFYDALAAKLTEAGLTPPPSEVEE